jgi:hypothetical protein
MIRLLSALHTLEWQKIGEKMIKKRIKIFILVFVFICFSQLSVYAEDVTVRVKGESSINKEEALHKAFQRAVEEGIGTYITSQQKISNFEVIYDNILKYSKYQ